MNADCERRLSKLEFELNSLKATYTISGGLMKTYVSRASYSISDPIAETPALVKFTSSYPVSSKLMICSFSVEQNTTSGKTMNFSNYAITLEQTENGAVTFRIPLSDSATSLSVGVVSTVPGTFSRVS